jgi:transcriptional regulator with XRE-family HTH domain
MKQRTSDKSSQLSSQLDLESANQKTGDRIRFLREQKRVSQKKLASEIGLSMTTIQNYERDINIPKGDHIVKLCSFFGVSADWLLFGKEELAPYGAGSDSGSIYNDTKHERVAKTLEDGQDFNTADIISKTIEILESKTVFTTAIVSNIEAFHEAIQMKKELKKFKAEMQTETAKMFNDIRKEVAKLRQENQQLRDEIRRDRDQEVTEDTG